MGEYAIRQGGELADGAFVDEARDGPFKGRSGSEGPYGGPLSLDRDLRGGIVKRRREHTTGEREVLVVEV